MHSRKRCADAPQYQSQFQKSPASGLITPAPKLLTSSKSPPYTLDMGATPKLQRSTPENPSIHPDNRRDPKTRRTMSGPAIRTFLNVAEAWKLNIEDQRGLLGWPPDSTFYKYKAGQVGALSYDMLLRISLVLGIFKDLRILYPERDLADRWVRLPNSNPLFGGKPALSLMLDAGMDGLYQVRRLLDARRGGWN